MLRWMIGIKRIEKMKITTEEIRAMAVMANIRKKKKKAILRWLGHNGEK